jgi:hypothetical protein
MDVAQRIARAEEATIISKLEVHREEVCFCLRGRLSCIIWWKTMVGLIVGSWNYGRDDEILPW